MDKIIINDNFIQEWHPKYDEIENDEKEYQDIIEEVKKDKAISRKTFERILRWESPRLTGIVKLDKFEMYDRGIKKCMSVSENDKLSILDELYGIGVPVASTILHFIYPDEFPIMDVRTVETLQKFGYIESRVISQKRYAIFRPIILNIHKRHSKWSLREIDRALFAYHKITGVCCSCGYRNKIKRCHES